MLKNIETSVSASDTVLDIETKTAIKIAPIVLLKPNLAAILSLRQSLDLQFKQLQQLTETEDSFDPRFGELYSAYARTLMKMGRLPEARKIFVNALHNVKVNNGVNSMQQRPVLRELFKMEIFTENVNDAEKHLKRLLWIEKENSDDSY
ncbi:MAG: tetratricopeptide (TPR) repeat protein [Arenicella sp.]